MTEIDIPYGFYPLKHILMETAHLNIPFLSIFIFEQAVREKWRVNLMFSTKGIPLVFYLATADWGSKIFCIIKC